MCDAEAEELLGRLFALRDEGDWIESVRAGMRVYLRWWRDRPESSWAYLVEMPKVGDRAASQRAETHERFVQMFTALAARARREQPGLSPVSPAALRVVIAGITDLVAEEVRAGRLERLGELEDELVRLAVRILADDATAERAVRA